MKTVLFAALCCLVLGAATTARCDQPVVSGQIPNDVQAEEIGTNPANLDPKVFGPRLAKHPEDEGYRIAAMTYYFMYTKDYDQLRQNTFAMIKYHPDNDDIFYDNCTAFYSHPDYRKEVIRRLEQQLQRGHKEQTLYYTLAQTCADGAIPPVISPSDRARFVQYMGLPQNVALQTRIDPVLADKAVLYYQDAIAAAGNDDFYPGFYSEQPAELYQCLHENDKALDVCQKALQKAGPQAKSGLLVEYGACLRQANPLDDAKTALGQVRSCDCGGEQNGPADDTIEAETELGLIALREGNVAQADKDLVASCNVQKSPADTTKGFPLELASKLLAAGQTKPVISFCQTVLNDFTPRQKETEDLLHRAEQASHS